MTPTIEPGSLLIVKKFGFSTYSAYGITIYDGEISDVSLMKRGEMYAFYPPNRQVPFVMRLIGLPGDEIYVGEGEVYVNNKKLESTLVAEVSNSKIYKQTIGASEFLVRYMNRPSLLPPLDFVVPDKGYFFLGDNRDNSSDSRVWGAVNSSDIIGEVIYVSQ